MGLVYFQMDPFNLLLSLIIYALSNEINLLFNFQKPQQQKNRFVK